MVSPWRRGGVLADYVPFYFANRSPMLYVIHKGGVPDYQGTQDEIVYLVTSVAVVVAGDRPWCFTDGHAVEEVTNFFTNTERLDKIDWGMIQNRSWASTEQDPDRKRRKQAEFLVYGSVPWSWFDRIGVIDQERLERVRGIIANAPHQPEVVVERGWYY